MRILIATTLLVALSSAAVLMTPPASMEKAFLNDPYIKYARTFTTYLKFYEESNGTLTPYKGGLQGVEYVDERRNFERLDLTTFDALLGRVDVQQFINLTSGILSQATPKFNHCERFDLGFTVNLTDIYNAQADPTSGLFTYLGDMPLPWNRTISENAFLIRQPFPELYRDN